MASLTRTIQASSWILHQLAVEVGSRWESVKVVLQQHHAGLLKQVQVGEEHPQVESHRRAAPPRAAGLILSGVRSANGQTFIVIFKSILVRLPVLLTSASLAIRSTRKQGWRARCWRTRCAPTWTSTWSATQAA